MSAPSSRPVVHLFVGLHKTGTTSIRFMLDVHRDLLGRYGFHLPRATWTQRIEGFWNGGHNNLAWEICRRRPIVPEWGTVDDLVREISARPDLQHVVFTEDLDYATTADLQRLKQAFAGFDVRVIVFLRNQVDWLRSMNAEERKFYGAPASDDWYREHVRHDPRIEFLQLCRGWANTFGTVTIRCYEQIRSRVLDALLECCGAPDALRLSLASRGLPRINASATEDTLALIHFASERAQRLGVDPGYFNTVISPTILLAARPPNRVIAPASAIPGDVADDLLRRIRVTNTALALEFGVPLPLEYVEPSIPSAVDAPGASALDLAASGEMFAAACFELGLRVGTRFQMMAGDATLANDIHALAERYCPWPTAPGDASCELDDLLLAAAESGSALYLERNARGAVAYRRKDGELMPTHEWDEVHWRSLVAAIHGRAHLNRNSWTFSEGHLIVRRGPATSRFWVRHAPTADGEVVVAEPEPHVTTHTSTLDSAGTARIRPAAA